MDSYPVLIGPTSKTSEVLKSRFHCDLAPATSIADAQAFVAEVRSRYPDANHHCYAFVIGPPGWTGRVGLSDDGEPHGTAGRPMLNVLLHADVGDVVAVVTRYFGGTKLGKGGLVRAYSAAVTDALAHAASAPKVDWVHLTLQADYGLAEGLRRLYARFEAELVDELFAAHATHRVRVPRSRCSALKKAIADESRGRIDVQDVDASASSADPDGSPGASRS